MVIECEENRKEDPNMVFLIVLLVFTLSFNSFSPQQSHPLLTLTSGIPDSRSNAAQAVSINSMSTAGQDKEIATHMDASPFRPVQYEIVTSLHSEMPEYRFLATGVSTNSGYDWAIGLATGLNIYDEQGAPVLAVRFSDYIIDDAAGNPIYEGNLIYEHMMDTMGLHVTDVNFDGYKDVIILSNFSGAHSLSWYNCWLWNPDTLTFDESESFAKIYNPAVDPEKQCIYSLSGGGSITEFLIYKYRDGEFIITNSLYMDGSETTECELINGEMVIIRQVDQVDYSHAADQINTEIEYYQNSALWQISQPHWYLVGGHHVDQWLED